MLASMAMDLRKDMERHTISGDGNCLFGSVGFCVSEDHTVMRKEAVAELRSYPEIYEKFLTIPLEEYCANMERDKVFCV